MLFTLLISPTWIKCLELEKSVTFSFICLLFSVQCYVLSVNPNITNVCCEIHFMRKDIVSTLAFESSLFWFPQFVWTHWGRVHPWCWECVSAQRAAPSAAGLHPRSVLPALHQRGAGKTLICLIHMQVLLLQRDNSPEREDSVVIITFSKPMWWTLFYEA